MDFLWDLWMASGENYPLFLIYLFAGAFVLLLPAAWAAYALGSLADRLKGEAEDV